MRKDSRLSFRISQILSERINKVIDSSEGQIRDRSELGSKAVRFYLDYIENESSELEVILSSILAISDSINLQSDEIKYIQEICEEKNHYPSGALFRKNINDHDKFDSLMEKLHNLKGKERKNLYDKLSLATYNDIDSIYDEFLG